MIIDSHEHLMLPSELQIEKMNEAGVDKTILFTTTPHPEKVSTLTEFKNEISVLFNILGGKNTIEANRKRMKKDILDMMSVLEKYSDRFYGFGSVPLGMSFEETTEWIERYIIKNRLKGIGEFTPGNDEQISQLETIFKVLEGYDKLPVWIHTFNPVTLNGIKIIEKFTLKYSDTPVIFRHMGGYNWMEVTEFVKNTQNAYMDLSAAFSTLALKMIISEIPKKCFFSSDAPYGDPLLNRQMIEYLSPSKKITAKILGENIMELLELE